MQEQTTNDIPKCEAYAPLAEPCSQDLNDIAALVSYELRTPLTSIRAALGLLMTGMLGTLPERGQRMLEIALSNTDRLMHLVEVLEREPELTNSLTTPQVAGNDSDLSTQRLLPLSLWRRQAYYDSLTGLPTQSLFLSWLNQAFAPLLTENQPQTAPLIAVLLVDLDRFQIINDSLGYGMGNQLLMRIAERLAATLPATGAIARLQADKFAILLRDVPAMSIAVTAAENIQQALTTPFNLNDQDIFVTASIGIAWNQTGYDRAEDLLHDADTAMYQAKALGKARYEIFDIGVRLEATSRLRLERDLRLALERQEFRLYYQPIVSVETQKNAGFEALIRWQHPENGLLSPLKFITLAEETGLINPIGQWVLREACRQLCLWQRQMPMEPPLTVSVNLSAQQFSQPDLVEQVQQSLQESGLNPHSLRLEITESAIMESPEVAATMLQQIKALGVQIYIDDFGTGYSSLAYLHRFPIDTLKIDRSFINRVDVDLEQLEIVRTIIQLAWNLGISVVAEGVETHKQLMQLKALRCEYAQGFFFSKPINGEAAGALIKHNLLTPN
ncbi:MAG: putative bifunctional diguanylate cyclase/phosphodiesterase [Stenomitos frigidus ULC029]